jgi:hypothetical protein
MEAIPIKPRDFTQLDLYVEKGYVEIGLVFISHGASSFADPRLSLRRGCNQEGT